MHYTHTQKRKESWRGPCLGGVTSVARTSNHNSPFNQDCSSGQQAAVTELDDEDRRGEKSDRGTLATLDCASGPQATEIAEQSDMEYRGSEAIHPLEEVYPNGLNAVDANGWTQVLFHNGQRSNGHSDQQDRMPCCAH